MTTRSVADNITLALKTGNRGRSVEAVIVEPEYLEYTVVWSTYRHSQIVPEMVNLVRDQTASKLLAA